MSGSEVQIDEADGRFAYRLEGKALHCYRVAKDGSQSLRWAHALEGMGDELGMNRDGDDAPSSPMVDAVRSAIERFESVPIGAGLSEVRSAVFDSLMELHRGLDRVRGGAW